MISNGLWMWWFQCVVGGLRASSTLSANTSAKGSGPTRIFVPAAFQTVHEEIQHRFRLLSWNILAPSWDNTWAKTRPSNWHVRFARIAQEIRLRKADILVLQEVEVLLYDEQIQPLLKARGYQSVYSGLDSGIGLAVFWRHTKFKLSHAVDIDLRDTSWSKWRLRDLSETQRQRYLSQPNVALFATLECLGDKTQAGHAVLIGATHLTANPANHLPLRLDLQLFQAIMLLDGMRRVFDQERVNHASLSVVLAGDFNVPQFFPLSAFETLTKQIENPSEDFTRPASQEMVLPSPVYDLMTQGSLTAESVGFLMTAMKASGFHPSSLLGGRQNRNVQQNGLGCKLCDKTRPGPVYDMFVQDRSQDVLISTYAHVTGTEPITTEADTLDFIFFMPGHRRHSRPARLAVQGGRSDACNWRAGVRACLNGRPDEPTS